MYNISSFVIYFNQYNKKIEQISSSFAKEFVDENGQICVNVDSLGHENCYKILAEKNIPLENIILLGSFFKQDKNISVSSLRVVNKFAFDNDDIYTKAFEKKISLMEERRNFSSLIGNFITGKVEYDVFKNLLLDRIFGLNIFIKKFDTGNEILKNNLSKTK